MHTSVTPPRIPRDRDVEDPDLEGTEDEVAEVTQDEVPVTVEGDYNPVLHTELILPKAAGSIPPTFTTITMAEQRATPAEFHGFYPLSTLSC